LNKKENMIINRHNYEECFILYWDNELSASQKQVVENFVNENQDLQEEFGLSYLFIAHDLSVVRHISNRIAVMYLGHIVEMGEAETIYQSPLHPYSRALLASAPRPDPQARRIRQAKLAGDIPSPINKPSGCPFRTRCPIAEPIAGHMRTTGSYSRRTGGATFAGPSRTSPGY
jgi:oligopeptide/dipeptide ABC transporter ATP-binding protein